MSAREILFFFWFEARGKKRGGGRGGARFCESRKDPLFFPALRFFSPSLHLFRNLSLKKIHSPPVAVDVQEAHRLVRGPRGGQEEVLEVLFLDVGAGKFFWVFFFLPR